MSEPVRCASCGQPLDPPGPGGLCPVCLLKMGLQASAGPGTGGADTAGTGTPGAAAAAVPGDIGPYHLLQMRGEGGMGIVYLAEQREPLVRRVALKLIKPGMDTREVLARFEAERQALALMDHPSIARVLDAGLGPGDRPYFVMEYVAGIPITEYCDRHRLRNAERLQIFLQVCSALQHAHQKGIIHRDLKPSNILVTVQDGKPVPKVIDFGIAKATRQGSVERAAFTQLGMLIGTPEYISPEQAEASGLEVDTTTDIYSLGVVLYELLTGVLPFEPETLRRAGYAEMHRIIREQDPPKPSLRVTALGAMAADIARQHQTTAPALGKQLRGDLDAIAMKAMEKDRTRRYASASEFGADIARYLNGEAVVASPPSVLYRARKFVRRHRLGVAAGALVAAALIVGLVTSTLFYVRAERARAEAVTAQLGAEHQAFLATVSASNLSLDAGLLDDAREQLLKIRPDRREWEWRFLFHKLDSSVATLYAFGDFSRFPSLGSSFVFSRDGTRVSWNTEETVHDWDTRTWQRGQSRGGFGRIHAVAPTGAILVTPPVGAADRQLRIIDPGSGRVLATLGQIENLSWSAAFSPDGTHVAAGTEDGRVLVWDSGTGRLLKVLPGPKGSVRAVAFRPDSGALAASGDDKVIRVWDLPSGRIRRPLVGHSEIVRVLAFAPDGQLLASGSRDRTVRLWDEAKATVRQVLRGHGDEVYGIAFSPDGRRLATTGRDGTVRIWSTEGGHALARVNTNSSGAYANSISFDPSGRRIFSSWYHGAGGQIQVWDADSPGVMARLPHAGSVRCLAASPDGTRLITGTSEGELVAWDIASRTRLFTVKAHESGVEAVAFDADGKRIASGGADRMVRVWDARQGTPLGQFAGHTDSVTAVAFSPTGGEIASGSSDKAVRMWDAFSGRTLAVWQGQHHFLGDGSHPDGVNDLAFNARGDTVYLGMGSCSHHRNTDTAGVWHWRENRVEPLIDGLQGSCVTVVSLSPDGRRVALGGMPAVVLRDDKLTAEMGRLNVVYVHSGVAFSPDGRRIATAGLDKTLRIWDAVTLEPLLTVPDDNELRDVKWCSDGLTVATVAGRDVHLWSARSAYAPDAPALVSRLRETFASADEIIDHLRGDDSIEQGLRAAAIELARAIGDSPAQLNRRAWAVVAARRPDPAALALALRRAELAVRLAPWDAMILNTLGVARYRAGAYRDAVATLEKSSGMRRTPSPADQAFLAMARFRLGQAQAARDALEKLEAEMKNSNNADDAETQSFLHEARELIQGTGGGPGKK